MKNSKYVGYEKTGSYKLILKQCEVILFCLYHVVMNVNALVEFQIFFIHAMGFVFCSQPIIALLFCVNKNLYIVKK